MGVVGAKSIALTCSLSVLAMSFARMPSRGRMLNVRKERSLEMSKKNPQFNGETSIPIQAQENKIFTASEAVQTTLGSEWMTPDADRSLSVAADETSSRELSTQLTGCCSTYQNYDSYAMCSLYNQNCKQGGAKSHDSGDSSCTTEGLAFIGLSFSVNTPQGNPYSYQLCDQFPMENIIDRDYNYVMSMDEDGWLVGGGYKTFDYSGKMPYIDSSHTELLRVGQLDPSKGGTSIDQVYKAMDYVTHAPLSIYPEYVKGGGGGKGGSSSSSVPSGDVTLIVSVVAVYSEQQDYSDYAIFLKQLFSAMSLVGGGSCMDDKDTDPHVSMARGVKFKSSYHQYQYFYNANLEVAVWQKMYPKGVVIGSTQKAAFPPNQRKNPKQVGYGNLYFFFDRANITKAFSPNRDLSSTESYYSTFLTSTSAETIQSIYSSVTYIPFSWNKKSGSKDKQQQSYEHNPYNWKSSMAYHDFTDGWDLPPNCEQEGETFFGIPLSTKSESKLQSTASFQEQFDFDVLCDHNYTYIKTFGTNHGWLLGEQLGNGVASIVDPDTAHIPLFYMGTTNPNMGGMTLSNMIKITKDIEFGPLYIKPAFVFSDSNGHIKLQFEADASSALGYLYDNLCKMMGISWNHYSPSNNYGMYSSCAMHATGDRASYGCGPGNANTGGFCPQMTIAYRAKFKSSDHASAYMYRCNTYIDYWRKLYPTGVTVGASKFCPEGGCLALFLNRMDVYQVFKPDKGGSWVFYNGGSLAPTVSPAPTWAGGCDDPHNMNLDKCFTASAIMSKPDKSTAWVSLGPVGQMCIVLVTSMAATLALSMFIVRAKQTKKRNESYIDFMFRDMGVGKPRGKKKTLKKKKAKNDLEESILSDDFDADEFNLGMRPRPAKSSRERSKSRSNRTRGRSSSRVAIRDEELPETRRGKSKTRSRDTSRGRGSSRGRVRSESRQRGDKEERKKHVNDGMDSDSVSEDSAPDMMPKRRQLV